MSLEEIARTILENPELTASTGAAAVYSAGTYLAGRSQKFTEKEAENLLDEGFYNSIEDYLKGLYGKGVADACRDELDQRWGQLDSDIVAEDSEPDDYSTGAD